MKCLPMLTQAGFEYDRSDRETFLIYALFEPGAANSLPLVPEHSLRMIHERYKAFPSSLNNDHLALLFACLCHASFSETMTNFGADGYRHMIPKHPSTPREDVTYFCRAMECLSTESPASVSSCCKAKVILQADSQALMSRGSTHPSRLDGIFLRSSRIFSAHGVDDTACRRHGAAYAVVFVTVCCRRRGSVALLRLPI